MFNIGTQPQSQPQPTVQPQSYAATQNAKYSNTQSNFVDMKDRINSVISDLLPLKQTGVRSAIVDACQKWINRFPNAKTLKDLDLVESFEIPLSDILIDTTMQRLLSITWVLSIVSYFRDVQAMPIQVYPVLEKDLNYTAVGPRGLYASWDGQHTLAVFYIIAVYILKLDPTKVMIPVNIYKVSQKSEIRENFVKGNGPEGKKLLDAIDTYHQMIYGVRVDGNKNPIWIEAERKQQYLEQADLFVTANKFNDTFAPGAISRLQEINGYSSDIIRKFALYTTTFPVARSIASQEIEIMCAWFDMAKKDGVDYTDAEIVDLGNHLHSLFGADFDESSAYWDKVRNAYSVWHTKYWAGFHQAPTLRFNKNWTTGGVFLWHQLKKTWPNARIPALSINSPFIPAQKDMY
jgi:hypothetical protein